MFVQFASKKDHARTLWKYSRIK